MYSPCEAKSGPASAGFVNAGFVSAAMSKPPPSRQIVIQVKSLVRISGSPVEEDMARQHGTQSALRGKLRIAKSSQHRQIRNRNGIVHGSSCASLHSC